MRKPNRYLVFMVVGGILLVGMAVQLYPRRLEARFPPHGLLKDLIPGATGEWSAQDLPLGETETLVKVMEAALRYDDYVYRIYRRGNSEVGVYIAYWKPGSSDRIEVGSHSPDKCWVQSGWNLIGPEQEQRFLVHGFSTELGQLRHFRKDQNDQYVVFWHLIGGVRSGYAQGDQRKWNTRAPAIVRSLVGSHLGLIEREQYFIRISSNLPIETLQKEPFFLSLLEAGAQFGICGGT